MNCLLGFLITVLVVCFIMITILILTRKKTKGTTLIDIIQVVSLFIFLILPFILAKLWLWVWFWVVILGVFIIFEVISYLTTNRTLSQRFGKFGREHPTFGKIILLCLGLGFGILIWHLMW